MKRVVLLLILFSFHSLLFAQDVGGSGMNIPERFISFKVPGLENEMRQIRAIYYEAYTNPYTGPGASFEDPWIPAPTLVIADIRGGEPMKDRWINRFLTRHIDDDGYVSTEQHFSHALDDGWPFPLFWQVPGENGFIGYTCGYLFQNNPASIVAMMSFYVTEMQKMGYMGDKALNHWVTADLDSDGIKNEAWELKSTGKSPSITTADGFKIEAFCAPFMQIRLASDAKETDNLKGSIQWIRDTDKDFSDKREIKFILNQPSAYNPNDAVKHCIIDMSKHSLWNGNIKKIRINLPQDHIGINYRIDSIFSAFNTRHQMNAFNFLIGSIDTFNNTGDVEFLKKNIDRMRKVMTYANEVLYSDKYQMIKVPYQGHDGIPGYVFDANGNKKYNFGHSIGGNYWDILPFGNLETYTSYYYYYTLGLMADLEDFIAKNPQLGIKGKEKPFDYNFLIKRSNLVKNTINSRLWNDTDGRYYAAEDVNGKKWDYGFTFLNLEAIYYGIVPRDRARYILDWIDGRRTVDEDTSKGADIYHWRLAPRATTKKNYDWYFWGWDSHAFPWGKQVQDGGAVFAQSFNDLMSRIKIYGPDNAWTRFKGILDWYTEVEQAGGYRNYYADGKKGNSMQGSGTAGGIGIDMEFVETILTPYTMLEGFLGFKATSYGFDIIPNYPESWSSYEVDNLAYRNTLLSFKLDNDIIKIKVDGKYDQPVCIKIPAGYNINGGKEVYKNVYEINLNNNEIIIDKSLDKK